ncbi:MAG: hypothetical protein IJ060_04915 [Oscillospiraceae bacterium]|nr:hypothetical protein [Oscillospiraceae bacterium]
MTNHKRSLSLRLTEAEDEKLNQLAEIAKINRSSLVRKILFSEDKIILLTAGSEIAAQLYQLNSKFDGLCRQEKISVQDAEGIRKELAHIGALLCDIVRQLSDLYNEEDENELAENDKME